MEGRELRRFPKGQTCSECPARRYYQESGFRYCQNGHRVEGFIEYDVDLEGDNFGQAGAISRKAREKRERQHKHLTGNAARELYLECLQLVLRKQVAWLVRERHLPPELETVVRDLWDLRVRNFGGLAVADEKGKGSGKGKGRRQGSREAKSEPASGSESEMLFSSQGEGDVSSDSESAAPVRGSRIKNWTVREGQKWPMPRLLDTLALAYVGCLAMRLPVRIADLLHWAKSGRLLFVGALAEIPFNMRDRLSPNHHIALRGKYSSLAGGNLHTAVTDLVMSYRKNYDIVFPPLNTTLVALRYLRELALPLETYVYAEKIVSLLRLDFSFTAGTNTPFKDPETLLVASIVLASKLLYPFDDAGPFAADGNNGISLGGLRLDWARWAEIFNSQRPKRRDGRDFESMTSADVYDLTGEDMDRYLDWYQETKITPRQDTRDTERLFPLIQPTSTPPIEEGGEENEAEIEGRIEEIREHIEWAEPGRTPDSDDADAKMRRLGKRHPRYETVEALSGPARVFHERAAEYSGLPMDKLLQAVFRLEQKLLYWQQVEKKGVDIDDVGDTDEGVLSRPLARLLGRREF